MSGTRLLRSLIAVFGLLWLPCAQGGEPAQGPFEPSWESLAKREPAPAWFRDAKFGIYFHWGVYSVPAYGNEWYPRLMYARPDQDRNSVYEHHVATWGDPTKFGYPDFVPMFRAEKFNADEWAALFAKSGARFAGPVAEHHDGYAMWDSALTPWNSVDTGPRRDITGELARAIRAHGMRLVTTFHHARNNLWEEDGKWTGHYQYVMENFPSLLEDPQRAIMYGYMPREQFLKMWLGKLQEVIDNYQPDLIWFDSWLDEIPDADKMAFLAHYFNRAAEWKREVVVTFKQQDLPRSVAVDDYEKGRADQLTDFVWLTDDTLSKGSWCYTNDLEIKSADEVIDTFLDIISKNGILLLNISPMADGTIPENQKAVLEEMGRWLAINGAGVFDTRPWTIYGEGPTQMKKGGSFVGIEGGYTPADIRFTTKGDTLYAIALGWPENGRLKVTSLGTASDQNPGKIGAVTLLGHDGTLRFEQSEEALVIQLPDQKPCEHAFVFEIKKGE